MKNLKPFLSTFFICITTIIISCDNDSESDLIDVTPVENISYNTTIKAIIDTNCTGCHQDPPVNGAPMSLATYNDVVSAIENRDLINRISSNDQSFLMPPQGPRLPQATIDLIIQWQTEGLIEE